jgi:RND family efflux transporter MFP subunit
MQRLLCGAPLLLLFALSACKRPGAEVTDEERTDSPATSSKAVVSTKFEKVVEVRVAPRLEVSGTLDPDERSEVAAQTSGTALTVNVDLGVRVKKGDVLVQLDGREASLRLDVANATTASQRARLGLDGRERFAVEDVAEVKMAREAAEIAKTDYERTKALFEAGATTKSMLDATKSNKERADAAYESARNGAEQGWTSLLASQSQAGLSSKSVDDTRIRAPFDGLVEAKRISEGEFAGMGRVVAVIVRDDVLRFRFDVAEADSGRIQVGNNVELEVAAFPNEVFKASIRRIGASVKRETRTLPIEAEVANAEHRLRPGFFARAGVELSGAEVPVLVVPRKAIRAVAGGSKVFVREGDKVVERLVTTGVVRGDLIEVRGQLKVGEEVAVENVDALSDGALLGR